MAATAEGEHFIWNKSIPRKGWIYEGDFHDLGSVIGNCQMCDHPIRYQHIINHPEHGELLVGSICASKMGEEGALENYTGWKIIDGVNPYQIVTEKRFKPSKKGFKQLKLPKNSTLYKMIANLVKCKPKENIFVYPEGGIFVPNNMEMMKTLLDQKNPTLLLIRRKIKEAYEKKIKFY